jgi:hypothetical protein
MTPVRNQNSPHFVNIGSCPRNLRNRESASDRRPRAARRRQRRSPPAWWPRTSDECLRRRAGYPPRDASRPLDVYSMGPTRCWCSRLVGWRPRRQPPDRSGSGRPKVSIWRAGNHDNSFGIRLTIWMILENVLDAAVPMPLLADHPNVQFNFCRRVIGTVWTEMHWSRRGPQHQ